MSATVRRIILTTATVAALAAPAAQAAIIRASAGMGPGESPAFLIGSEFHFGYRFTIDGVVQVEQVGGHMGLGGGTLFAAIVSLSGPNALPSGAPFDGTTLATAVFNAPASELSVDLRVPLPITLNPGSYALVFGSGLYGAFGTTYMPLNNPPFSSPDSLIGYRFDDSRWRAFGGTNIHARFVIEGVVIPEPSMALFAAAAGILGLRTRHARSVLNRTKGAIS
jgi:hypothetical protein